MPREKILELVETAAGIHGCTVSRLDLLPFGAIIVVYKTYSVAYTLMASIPISSKVLNNLDDRDLVWWVSQQIHRQLCCKPADLSGMEFLGNV